MPANRTAPNWQRYFFFYATIVLVIASLYFGRLVILPVVLSILIAFILSPLVTFLQRHGFNRILSVGLVVGSATLFFAGLIFAVGYQAVELATEIPKYRANILNKISSFQDAQESGPFKDFIGTIQEVGQKIEGEDKDGDPQKPVPVKVQQSNFPLVQTTAYYVMDFLVQAGLVLLLVFFILLNREDLRNRLIGACGSCNLNTTTKALDEAGQRVSRFLGMQFIVNATYGAALGAGLWLMDVPFAFIWGILAALLRYIPYLGPWLAAIFPLTISFATSQTWEPLLWVLGYILVLELISNNFMEPWLYGRSIGVSEIGILLAAAFWTLIWGPLGLILATPITACLVVFGRYVPSLSLIPHFLGKDQVLPTEVTFYQRLLARDVEEANDLVETHLVNHPVETVYDDILLPALMQAKRYQDEGSIDREDRKYILAGIRQIVEEVVEPAMDESHEKNQVDKPQPRIGRRVRILGLSWEPAGETGLYLLKSMMDLSQCEWRIFPMQGGWGEALDQVRREKPRMVVIGTMNNRRLGRVRTLVRRLKHQFPDLMVVVHAWGQENVEPFRDQLQKVGAEDVEVGFVDGWKQLTSQVHSFIEAASNAEAAVVANGAGKSNGARKTPVHRKQG